VVQSHPAPFSSLIRKTTDEQHDTSKNSEKKVLPILIEPLIQILHNIQSQIDSAAGAATALELRLGIIAQLEPKVQTELKKQSLDPYHKAKLVHLIDSVLTVFQDRLDTVEQDTIKKCRPPRNYASHGSFVELMFAINGEAPGREMDPRTRKGKPLAKNDLVEGAKCIEKSRGLDLFSQRAKKAVEILEIKVLRSLQP
jgi:hypothetical protein